MVGGEVVVNLVIAGGGGGERGRGGVMVPQGNACFCWLWVVFGSVRFGSVRFDLEASRVLNLLT